MGRARPAWRLRVHATNGNRDNSVVATDVNHTCPILIGYTPISQWRMASSKRVGAAATADACCA